jgi:hypothetical protein
MRNCSTCQTLLVRLTHRYVGSRLRRYRSQQWACPECRNVYKTLLDTAWIVRPQLNAPDQAPPP